VQCRDVRVIFLPEQNLLVREDAGEPGEWPSLDGLGPVDQVIGIPVGRYPPLGELDQPVPEQRHGGAVDASRSRAAVFADALPYRPAGHDVQVADAGTQSVGEQRAAAEDHEVTEI
jgi:hypothetical protein